MATIKVKRRHTTGGTASTTDGELSVNSFDKKIFIGNGSSAIEISNQVGYSTIATVGTITSGTWQGTAIGAIYGGTAQTSYAAGDLLYASATNTLSKLTKPASSTSLLQMTSAGVPSWVAMGTGIATFLTTPSSGNLAAAITDETGSGKLVFDTSPTFNTSATIRKTGIATNIASLTLQSSDIDSTISSSISCSLGDGYDLALADSAYNHLKIAGNSIYIGDMDGAGSSAYIVIDTAANADANILMYGFDTVLSESNTLSVGPGGVAVSLSTNGVLTLGSCTIGSGQNGMLTTKSISASRNSTVATFDRLSTDGQIISLKQAGTEEGSISVSGTTITYGTFSGSHLGQLTDSSTPNILRGTVMETVDELCEWVNEPSPEQLVKVKISDTPASNRVYGVFMNWDMDDQVNTHDMLVTSLGAFVVRIAAGVTVQGGDLLESNGNGCARVQSDNIIRASTIGKVSSNIVTHTHADGSYCVPATLYCG